MKSTTFTCFIFLLISVCCFSQGSDEYGKGIRFDLDSTGQRYMRVIAWAQVWGQYNDNAPENESATSISLRRARLLTITQINEKYLILTHFGTNSLNANNMSPLGTGNPSQLFFHDIWGQYNLNKNHSIGAGLHYWNGISRLNTAGTLNFLTLDNNRQSWSTLGLSDQFARHIGIYAKGSFNKFQYRVSINEAITNSLDTRDPSSDYAVYEGRKLLGSKHAGKTYAGYFEYALFDAESNYLPFKVGSYLGTKKVFNIGAGFFAHPKGSVIQVDSHLKGENVYIFAVDAFYDAPLGEGLGAITAYATYQNNDYGHNYLHSAYGTGSIIYAHFGYLLPTAKKSKIQPYVSFASNSYDAVQENRNSVGIGSNLFLDGHNSKLTLDYKHEKFGADKTGILTLQAMIYL